jgi:hypothetical protein
MFRFILTFIAQVILTCFALFSQIIPAGTTVDKTYYFIVIIICTFILVFNWTFWALKYMDAA